MKAWQQGAADDRVCRRFQARLGLALDGIVGPITWPATFTYPALTDATSALAVELATVDPLDPASGATLVDATGNNQIFVEAHSRSVHSLGAEDVIVVLLLAEATPSVPALPAGSRSECVAETPPRGQWLGVRESGCPLCLTARAPAGRLS